MGDVTKKLVLRSVALTAMIAGPAMAADMPVKAPPKAVAPAPAYSWTGFYVGGNVGYSWGRPDGDTTLTGFGLLTLGPVVVAGPFTFAHSDPLKFHGVVGGAQLGYNWQVSPNWVYGLEADWQASSETAGLNYADPYSGGIGPFGIVGTATTSYEAKISWLGTVRGRLG
jgi:outer membrane immunogenic protein